MKVSIELTGVLFVGFENINILMHNIPKWSAIFKNLVANAARLLKSVWPFWDVMQ